MSKKYTKNDHMHRLNDGEKPIDPEANQLIKARLARAGLDGHKRNTSPQHIGQWLQVTHRDVFNRDFDLYVESNKIEKHFRS